MLPESLQTAIYTTAYRNIAPGSTGAIVKASTCQVFHIQMSNTDTNPVYIKLYNKATAATSSDTPIFTYAVNAASSIVINLDAEPILFSAGLSVRATSGLADNDTGSPTSAKTVINLLYK